MSRLFQEVMFQLDINQLRSSAYHSQSQGALERLHQTLKSMIQAYCFQEKKDWDEGISFLLFAMREAIQASLGFSPFELVFGHTPRGSLKLPKEAWLDEDQTECLLTHISDGSSYRSQMSLLVRKAQCGMKTRKPKNVHLSQVKESWPYCLYMEIHCKPDSEDDS